MNVRILTKLSSAITGMVLNLAFLLCLATASAGEPYVIDTLHVHIVVRDDNSYLVTEAYGVTFNEQQYGIERNLPLRSRHGNRVVVHDISAGGRSFSTGRSIKSDRMSVTIDDPTVQRNKKVQYKLSYVFDIGDEGQKQMDELHYNMVSGFYVRVKEMTFVIEMPKPFDTSLLSFIHGSNGTIDKTAVEWHVNGTTITGRLKKTNKPYDYIRIILPLPKGYYTTASGRTHRGNLFICLVIALSVAGAGLLLWNFFGRDRITHSDVELHPPQDLTPADAGYIMNGRLYPKDVIALIIYWADNGYLKISEIVKNGFFSSKKGFLLHKLQEMGEEAERYEKVLFDAIFRCGKGNQVTTFALRGLKFSSSLGDTCKEIDHFHGGNFRRAYQRNIRELLHSSFRDFEPKNLIFRSIPLTRIMVGFPTFVCFLAVWFIVSQQEQRFPMFPLREVVFSTLFLSIWCTGVLCFIGAMLSSIIFDLRKGTIIYFVAFMIAFSTFTYIYGTSTDFASMALQNGLVLFIVPGTWLLKILYTVLTIVFFFVTALMSDTLIFTPFTLQVSLAGLLVPLILMFKCRRRTELGLEYMEHLTGFKSFLETAKRGHIYALANRDPQYFYDVLPYAMVLGVTNTWAQKFENVVSQAPEWYKSSTSESSFSASLLVSELSEGFSGLEHSLRKALMLFGGK
jgi:hypothetical protein